MRAHQRSPIAHKPVRFPVTVWVVGPVLELGLLGPFEARLDGGAPVALGGLRQRALLAVLGLHPNEVVSTDRLIDELWGEQPPSRAVHTIQVFVSRLRSALGAGGGRLLTRPPGYVLELGADEVDAARCERLYESGRSALRAGDPAGAAASLKAAIELWRGRPLADFTYEPFAQAAIARLEELRLSCREEIVEAELALGRHAEVVSELEGLVREEPLRERPRGQLMLALYRCGRQAEALEAFQQARRMLVDELGLDPSPALQELEGRILRQDPSLQAEPSSSAPPWRSPLEAPADDEARVAPVDEVAVSTPERQAPVFVRKTVTVLVARLELSVRADPEVARARISVARDEAEQIIRRHGGTVISRLGGEVLGVFGVPVTREDDPQRALGSVEELRARLPDLGGAGSGELLLRAFVDTGEVVADSSGDLSGEPVSRALELVHAARPSEVLLSHATGRMAATSIQLEPALDGAAWRLLGIVADGPVLREPEHPMVDRDTELTTARMTFERVARTRSTHLLTVLGEAGIGKSRLAQELVYELGGQATVLTGRCLSYGEGIAFWPLREAITQRAGGESRGAIHGLLEGADDADVVADIVAGALGLVPAESIGEQVPWAFRRLLEEMANDRPVVLLLEDVHWGDDQLLDLVDYLIDWLTVPTLVLCLARPELLEVRPGWGGGHERVSSIVLSPLDEEGARKMLDQHLGNRDLSAAARAEILGAAEGNPLFLEQLLHVSAEDPSWNSESQIPATIQSLLAARLDRLGPGERALIERAAVIGREFWPSAVIELLPAEARTSATQHLRSLVRRGLIHPDRSTLAGEEQLRFHHILICDVAYHSTPKALRAKLHERLADWVAKRGEQYDEFIGYHLEQAFRFLGEIGRVDSDAGAVPARAGDHLLAAGRKASLRGDAISAVSLLRRAAYLFEAASQSRPDVLLDLGIALSDSGELREADHVLNASLEQAEAVKAEALAARVLIELSALRALVDSSARVEETREVAERAIEVFERLGDDSGLARAMLEVADVHWTRCCFGEMEQALERALTHAERAGQREQIRVLRRLAQAAVMGPRPVDDAIRRCKAILERVADDVLSGAFTQSMLAMLEAMAGRFDQARSLWRDSQQRLHDVGLSVTAAAQEAYRAFIELMSDTPVDVGPELAEACALLQRIGERSRLSTVAALHARLLYVQARYDEAEHYVAISAEAAADDDVVSQVIMRGTRAKLLAGQGDRALAEEVATSAVSLAAETDFLFVHADALRDRAEVLKILGRPRQAAEDLERAIVLYERKGVRTPADAARRLHRSFSEALTATAPSG
jgi:DNA-binding SARP family transcriptional activator/class 3 adenylate cyclase